MNITAITRDEIKNGFQEGYYCCMSGIEKRCFKCNMWLDIFDEIGGIGYLARKNGIIVAQLIFLPKQYARRILLPTGPSSDDIERAISINCLYVLRDFGAKGIASEMIKNTIEFCKQKGFAQIEACVDNRPPHISGMNTSFMPFRKFGFEIITDSEIWEENPEIHICALRV